MISSIQQLQEKISLPLCYQKVENRINVLFTETNILIIKLNVETFLTKLNFFNFVIFFFTDEATSVTCDIYIRSFGSINPTTMVKQHY